MKSTILTCPDGQQIRVVRISPEELERNVEARRIDLTDASNNLTADDLVPHT